MNNPRNLAMAGAAVLAGVYFLPLNVFNTPATKQVGETMNKGGGSPTHSPAVSSQRGSLNSNSPQISERGVDSKHFQENVANQAPGEPGRMEKKWNQAHFGTDKGKPS